MSTNNKNDWVQKTDEMSNIYWENKITGEISYDDPTVWEVSNYQEDQNWTAGVNEEDGSPYWFNEDSGEIVYEKPFIKDTSRKEWIEGYDENGKQYWYNEITDETLYNNPDQNNSNNNNKEWIEGYDAKSKTLYWYCEATDETIYEDPSTIIEQNQTEKNNSFNLEQQQVGEEEDSVWIEGYDENGIQYWYNEITDETRYDSPENQIINEEIENNEQEGWIEGYDENGIQYWYNEITDETQYNSNSNFNKENEESSIAEEIDESNIERPTGDEWMENDHIDVEEEIEEEMIETEKFCAF